MYLVVAYQIELFEPKLQRSDTDLTIVRCLKTGLKLQIVSFFLLFYKARSNFRMITIGEVYDKELKECQCV